MYQSTHVTQKKVDHFHLLTTSAILDQICIFFHC